MNTNTTIEGNELDGDHHEVVGELPLNDGATSQFLTFTVGDEEYGVDIMIVREVKGWVETTRLPNTPSYTRGVLNLRGVIVPIFDLRARFGGELTNATEKNVVVIVAVEERTVGILVDTVSDIITIHDSEIKPPPNHEAEGKERCVSGLIPLEKQMVVLLDMPQLLDDDLEGIDLHAPPPPDAVSSSPKVASS